MCKSNRAFNAHNHSPRFLPNRPRILPLCTLLASILMWTNANVVLPAVAAGDNSEWDFDHGNITRSALACPQSALEDRPVGCFETHRLDQLAGRTFRDSKKQFGGAVGAPDIDEPLSDPKNAKAHCTNADYLDVSNYPQRRSDADKQLVRCIHHLSARFWEGIAAAGNLFKGDSATWLDKMVPGWTGENQKDPQDEDCSFVKDDSRAWCQVIEGLGRALHGIQDFYLYSNWADEADPALESRIDNPPGLNLPAESPLLDLRAPRITWGFDSKIYEKIPDQLTTGFVHSPDTCPSASGRVALACLKKGIEADTYRGRILRNSEKAEEAAILETRRVWRDFRAELKRRFGAFRGCMIELTLTRDQWEKDVLISDCADTGPTPLGVIVEDFERPLPHGLWRSVNESDSPSLGQVWQWQSTTYSDANFQPHGGAASAWPAAGIANGLMGLDPAKYLYPPKLQSRLEFGPLNLRDAEVQSANLTFWLWSRTEKHRDYLQWGVRTNDTYGMEWLEARASAWQAIGDKHFGARVSGNTNGWQKFNLSLGNVFPLGDVTEKNRVWIEFRFISNDRTASDGPFIDDVTVNLDHIGCCVCEDSDVTQARAQLRMNEAMVGTDGSDTLLGQVNAPIQHFDIPAENSRGSSKWNCRGFGEHYQHAIDQFAVTSPEFAPRYRPSPKRPEHRSHVFAGDVMRAMGAPLPTMGDIGTGGSGMQFTDPRTAPPIEINDWLRNPLRSMNPAIGGWSRIDVSSRQGLQQLVDHVMRGKPAMAIRDDLVAVVLPNQEEVTRLEDIWVALAGRKNHARIPVQIGFELYKKQPRPDFFIHP